MIKHSHLMAGALALGALTAAPAQAQDFGIGAGATLGGGIGAVGGFTLPLPGPLVGIEASYWLDDAFALDFYGSIGVMIPDAADARFDLALGAGILYAIAQGDDTKLELGARLGVIAVINQTFGLPAGTNDEDADLFADVLLRVEHWFDGHFAINGQVGVNFRGDPDGNPGFGMLIGANAGLGMMYYFDGNARPGEGGAESAPIVSSGGNGGGGGGGGTSSPPPPSSSGGSEPPPDPESGAAGW